MLRRFFTGAVLGQGCGHARCRAQDTAEARGDSTGAVLGLVLHARRCATTAALVSKAENCAGSAVAVLLCGPCPCCAGSSWRPVLDKVVDMPVIVNDRVLHSGGASDTVHRLFMWTFQLCNTDGYDVSSIFRYGGDDWVFDAFCVIFRAPPGCPGVERQFLEPSMAKSSLPSRAPHAN